MNDYIIDENTLVIIGLDSNHSKVINYDIELNIKESCQNILNRSCLYYGSSFQGRVDGSRFMLHKEYKVPIILSEKKGIILFPVGTLMNGQTMWISLSKLDHYVICGCNVRFVFDKQKEVIIEVGSKSLESQLLKAYNLERVFLSRYKNC